MKFSLLPQGQRFDLGGEIYVKDGPLTARGAAGGGQKIIPRSAQVTPLSQAEPRSSSAPEALAAQAILDAFERYHRECLSCLDQLALEVSPETLAAARDRLERARGAFMKSAAPPKL